MIAFLVVALALLSNGVSRAEDAVIRGDVVVLNGAIKSPLKVEAKRLVVGADARIEAPVIYSAEQDAEIDPRAIVRAPLDRVANGDRRAAPPLWPYILLGLISAFFALRQPSLFDGAREAFERHAATSLRQGLLVLCVPLAVIGVFRLMILGWPFALLLSSIYGMFLCVAWIAAVQVLGRWMMIKSPAVAAALGSAVLWLATSIVGGIALALAALLGSSVISARPFEDHAS